MQLMAKTTKADMTEQQVPIQTVAQWTDKDRNIHEAEDTIRGYVYGGKAISVPGNLHLSFQHFASYLYSDN